MAVFFGCLLLLSSAFASVERRNTVCYNPFGCFSSDGLLKAPQSPDIIDTYFRLYVRGHSSHINEIGGKAGRVMSDFNSCSILYGIHQIPGIRLFQSRYTIYIIIERTPSSEATGFVSILFPQTIFVEIKWTRNPWLETMKDLI